MVSSVDMVVVMMSSPKENADCRKCNEMKWSISIVLYVPIDICPQTESR